MIKQVMVKQITIAAINERDSFLPQSCLYQFSPLKKSRQELLCRARQTYKIVLPCGPFHLLSASCSFCSLCHMDSGIDLDGSATNVFCLVESNNFLAFLV